MNRRPLWLFIAGIVLGCGLGIVLQRFYPVGQWAARWGLRDWIPISRATSLAPVVRAPADWDVPADERGRLRLFALLGQSNMSGRGDLNSLAVPQPQAGIYALNKDFRWAPAREPLGTAPNEVDGVATDGSTGVGPGLAFAHELVRLHPTWKIGLIPCARGASTIQEWQPAVSQNSLYGACLRRIHAASSYGTLAGVLFAQGESDADDPQIDPQRVLSPATWRDQFSALVQQLRADTHQPLLPVLFTQLGQYSGPTPLPNWDAIKRQQAAVQLPRVQMLPTADLPLQADAHFSTESQIEIGRRFAQAYEQWLSP